MIAKENQVVIIHLGDPCVFAIDRCELTVTERGLDLDIFTRPNDDCPLGHLGAPEIHIESATVKAKSIDALKDEELNVPIGGDTDEETKKNNIFRIYISQHEPLNNNHVKIVRGQGNRIEIQWTADAQNFLDFRDPDCTVEAFCITKL